jgi:hypothetical protein
MFNVYSFFIFFLYDVKKNESERGREGEREGEDICMYLSVLS